MQSGHWLNAPVATQQRKPPWLLVLLNKKPRTLDELNSFFTAWLNEQYHKSGHSGLNGMSPSTAWRTDTHLIYYPPAEALREAFLHTEERQVDKTGCINFNGAQYEVGMKLIGRKVEVLYDTTWLDEIEIHHKDFEPFRAKKLVIGENCQGSKAFPSKFTVEASESRLLSEGKSRQSQGSSHCISNTLQQHSQGGVCGCLRNFSV